MCCVTCFVKCVLYCVFCAACTVLCVLCCLCCAACSVISVLSCVYLGLYSVLHMLKHVCGILSLILSVVTRCCDFKYPFTETLLIETPSQIFRHRCSRDGCRKREMVALSCHQCSANFCIVHRHPLDHACPGSRHPVSTAG